MGAWALNQAVRRRREETEALLDTGRRLRAAHEELLGGGDPAVLREAMEEERWLTSALADCAEAIASESGKSGPALRDRVRATLHAASVEDEAREELAAGRFVREREAIGLGAFGGRRRGRGRAHGAPSGPPAKRTRSAAGAKRRRRRRRRAAGRRSRAARPTPRLLRTPHGWSRSGARARRGARALTEAEADHAASISNVEAARERSRRRRRRSARPAASCASSGARCRSTSAASSARRLPGQLAPLQRLTAGPIRTSPRGPKREPWQGQSQVRSPEFQFTMQPRCVQRADSAVQLARPRRGRPPAGRARLRRSSPRPARSSPRRRA